MSRYSSKWGAVQSPRSTSGKDSLVSAADGVSWVSTIPAFTNDARHAAMSRDTAFSSHL